MYALFWQGARITNWYESRNDLIHSEEYRSHLTKYGLEIRKA